MEYQIKVGEVCRESFSIILRKPIILLPMLVALLLQHVVDLLETRIFLVLQDRIIFIKYIIAIIAFLVTIINYSLFESMYPLMVKNVLENKEIELTTAFRSVVKKAPSIIVSGVLVILIVIAGFFLLIIPGLIFLSWYYYTIPAIMLENRGAIDGMKASKAFARDKKFDTLLLYIIPSTLAAIPFGLFILLFILLLGLYSNILPVIVPGIYYVINVILYGWLSVISAYVYIRNRMVSNK